VKAAGDFGDRHLLEHMEVEDLELLGFDEVSNPPADDLDLVSAPLGIPDRFEFGVDRGIEGWVRFVGAFGTIGIFVAMRESSGALVLNPPTDQIGEPVFEGATGAVVLKGADIPVQGDKDLLDHVIGFRGSQSRGTGEAVDELAVGGAEFRPSRGVVMSAETFQ